MAEDVKTKSVWFITKKACKLNLQAFITVPGAGLEPARSQ